MAGEQRLLLDLGNPIFQDALFALQKPERLAVLDTLKKLRQLNMTKISIVTGCHNEAGNITEFHNRVVSVMKHLP